MFYEASLYVIFFSFIIFFLAMLHSKLETGVFVASELSSWTHKWTNKSLMNLQGVIKLMLLNWVFNATIKAIKQPTNKKTFQLHKMSSYFYIFGSCVLLIFFRRIFSTGVCILLLVYGLKRCCGHDKKVKLYIVWLCTLLRPTFFFADL